jgi:preprotein translocase subunit SecA
VKSLSVVTDLKKAYETEGKQLLLISRKTSLYRSLMKLGKKHLRKMDD